MWLRDILSSLRRRWYVVIVLLVVTAGLCWIVRQSVASTYRSYASLVLMPPPSTVGPGGNPFLFLGGLTQALDVLSAEVSAADTADSILAAHPGVSYTAEPDRSSSGAIIRVSVSGGDPDQVSAALHDSITLVHTTLTSIQDKQQVADGSRIGLMTLVVDEQPTEDTKAKTLGAAAMAAAGIIFSILLTGLIDGRLLAQAEARKSGRNSEESASQSTTTPSDPWSEEHKVKTRQTDRPDTGGVQQEVAGASFGTANE